MKIKLRIENYKKEFVDIPITIDELASIWDIGFMLEDDNSTIRTMKLNKIEKDFWSIWNKLEFAINDVYHEGKTLSFKGIDDKEELRWNKKRHYLVKKPKWKTPK